MIIKSTSQLFKSILLSPPLYNQELISRKIAALFKFKLISGNELVRQKGNDIAPAIFQEMNKNLCRSWLLDGFPRCKDEAEQLWNTQKCHIAMNLRLPMNIIISQCNKNRFLHPASGRIYSMEFNPPKRVGKDDVTNEELVKEEDMSSEEILDEILDREDDRKPVLDYYRNLGVLQDIHGNSTDDLINKSRICLTSILPDSIM